MEETESARSAQPAAVAVAEKAKPNGRPYPNLVDNMWATRLPHATASPSSDIDAE
ncbi:hypothetical protein NB693_25730 [Pantoea ananatis]|uniref:hypothetical protein n=1 Tax=Pantoea ananas TaxID=553 RepID=UPI0022210BF5|nr:hypothetical protein [Pantoea ananatis]